MSKKAVTHIKIVVLLKLVVLAAFIFADIFSGFCMIGVILFVKWLCRDDHLPWVATSFGVAALSFAGCMVMYQPTAALGFPAALVGSVALTFVFGIPIDLLAVGADDDEKAVSGQRNGIVKQTAHNTEIMEAEVIDD